jgi:small GTP-binding protein
MIQKKVCMLGAFAVGKSSLVTRFTHNTFSEKYLTTIGVRVDKAILQIGEKAVHLILWDLAGEDDFHQVRTSYLRGASGCLLVVDGTRRATLETAWLLWQRTRDAIGPVPFVLLLNKADLAHEWEVEKDAVAELTTAGLEVIRTSAKTGQGVQEAHVTLARQMLDEQSWA